MSLAELRSLIPDLSEEFLNTLEKSYAILHGNGFHFTLAPSLQNENMEANYLVISSDNEIIFPEDLTKITKVMSLHLIVNKYIKPSVLDFISDKIIHKVSIILHKIKDSPPVKISCEAIYLHCISKNNNWRDVFDPIILLDKGSLYNTPIENMAINMLSKGLDIEFYSNVFVVLTDTDLSIKVLKNPFDESMVGKIITKKEFIALAEHYYRKLPVSMTAKSACKI